MEFIDAERIGANFFLRAMKYLCPSQNRNFKADSAKNRVQNASNKETKLNLGMPNKTLSNMRSVDDSHPLCQTAEKTITHQLKTKYI